MSEELIEFMERFYDEQESECEHGIAYEVEAEDVKLYCSCCGERLA